MAEAKKKSTTKDPMADIQKHAEKLTKATDQVFDNLKKRFDKKKVDDWQAKWLAVPANRKKYEKLSDAPEVVGEELVAMTNDIIDFIQGEEGGKSSFLTKIKNGLGGLFKKAATQAQKGVSVATDQAKKGADMATKQAKKTAGSAKSAAGKTAKAAPKKAGGTVKKAAKK